MKPLLVLSVCFIAATSTAEVERYRLPNGWIVRQYAQSRPYRPDVEARPPAHRWQQYVQLEAVSYHRSLRFGTNQTWSKWQETRWQKKRVRGPALVPAGETRLLTDKQAAALGLPVNRVGVFR